MNTKKNRVVVAPALLAVALLVAACSSHKAVVTKTTATAPGGGALVVAYVEGVPGGVMLNAQESSAEIIAIDTAKRELTLVGPRGTEFVAELGSEVVNFSQLAVGDTVKMTLTQQVAVFMDDAQAPAVESAGLVAAAAPEGAMPGMAVADAAQLTATLAAIDLENRTATLQFADGSSKTVPVRPDVDLSKHKTGEQIVFRMSEMITVELIRP